MKFEEILPSLRNGKKVRKTDWEIGRYAILKSDEFYDEEDEVIGFTNFAILSENWEVVEEHRKGCEK